MYLVIVVTTMLLAPLASIIGNVVSAGAGDLPATAAKWFVFWAIGIRLLLAGLRQITQPGFTARAIFKIDDPAATKLVSKIGFANVALGSVATASLIQPSWVTPTGIAGAIFLGLAGTQHVRNGERNTKETIAMVSDLAGAALIALTLLAASAR